MSVLTLVSNCHLSGRPPEGQFLVMDVNGVQRMYGLPPELLPPCSRCGAPTVIGGEIDRKYFYARSWPLRHVWCMGCVPWWVHVESKFFQWRWRLTRIPAYRPWFALTKGEAS